jgi:UDP-N-acetylmuramate-alanine ligase
MVIEACEYRNAFLHYHPDIAVITNIDPDHLDFFKTEEAYFESFQKFMEQSRCVVILAEEYSHFQSFLKNKEEIINNKVGIVGSDNQLPKHSSTNAPTH